MASSVDSWAVLAWLDGEEPARRTLDAILADERPSISWINLVEVEYRLIRDHGIESAEETLDEVRAHLTAELPGVARMREVARLKAEHPIALADCFAIATAGAADAELLTGDPEIVKRADALPCPIRDLRS